MGHLKCKILTPSVGTEIVFDRAAKLFLGMRTVGPPVLRLTLKTLHSIAKSRYVDFSECGRETPLMKIYVRWVRRTLMNCEGIPVEFSGVRYRIRLNIRHLER